MQEAGPGAKVRVFKVRGGVSFPRHYTELRAERVFQITSYESEALTQTRRREATRD